MATMKTTRSVKAILRVDRTDPPRTVIVRRDGWVCRTAIPDTGPVGLMFFCDALDASHYLAAVGDPDGFEVKELTVPDWLAECRKAKRVGLRHAILVLPEEGHMLAKAVVRLDDILA